MGWKQDSPRLVDVLPALAEEVKRLLPGAERGDLVEQVDTLRVMGRCKCGDGFCGTIQVGPSPARKRAGDPETIPLCPEVGWMNLDVVKGQIIGIEVLYRPEIRARVLELFP